MTMIHENCWEFLSPHCGTFVWLVGWLLGWLAGSPVGRLIGSLDGGLIDRLGDCFLAIWYLVLFSVIKYQGNDAWVNEAWVRVVPDTKKMSVLAIQPSISQNACIECSSDGDT